MRLPYAVQDVFGAWLKRHFPDRRELRGGKLNDADFGTRMGGSGPMADQIRSMFQVALRRTGLNRRGYNLSTGHFRRVQRGQMELFD